MDALRYSNAFKPIASEGDEVESSHLQLDSTLLDSQFKEVVESIHLHLDSSSLDAKPVIGKILLYNRDAQVVGNHASHSRHGPQVVYVENAQVVNNFTSNSGQSSDDPQVVYVGPSSLDSSNHFTYNGVTYYSYEAFGQDFRTNLMQEMQWDGVVLRFDEGSNEPQFSNSMVFATGGSPAVINPHNGLPWREGANLCRPYMDEGCCLFGTSCIFHHPWPPKEELP